MNRIINTIQAALLVFKVSLILMITDQVVLCLWSGQALALQLKMLVRL